MATYYAVCWVGGPISHAIQGDSDAEAISQFESADVRAWIDAADADAEDDLDIEGADGMDESEFGAALEEAGCIFVADLSPVHNYHAGTTAHLLGGWLLYRAD